MAELLSFCLCVINFLYYFFLFQIPDNGVYKIIFDLAKAHQNRNANDTMMMLFPREVGCVYMSFGTGNQLSITHAKCKVGYQDFNEFLNIIAFLFSAIVLALYILNIAYLMYTIITFSAYLKNPTRQDVKSLSRLSMRKRLVVIILYNNMDRNTHEALMRAMIYSTTTIDRNNPTLTKDAQLCEPLLPK